MPAQASDLVSPGALKTALSELSSRISTVNGSFITSATNLKVVNASTGATSDLTSAMQHFQKFFLDAQKSATTAGASISTITGVADMYLQDITSPDALETFNYMAQDFESKEKPRYELGTVVTPLQKVRTAVDTLISKLAAAERKELDAAMARVDKSEALAEQLKAEFKNTVPGVLQQFGVSDESPSMILYLTLAPYTFLEQAVTKLTGAEADPEEPAAEEPAAEEPSAEEPAAEEPAADTTEDAVAKPTDKKAAPKGKFLSKENVGKAKKSTALLKKVIDLQKRMQSNKEELKAAKTALDRLKTDQSADDRQAKLRTVLIDIADIKNNIAEISPKVTILGSIFQTMAGDMKSIAALLEKKDTVKAKAQLNAANRVYKELEGALTEFAIAV